MLFTVMVLPTRSTVTALVIVEGTTTLYFKVQLEGVVVHASHVKVRVTSSNLAVAAGIVGAITEVGGSHYPVMIKLTEYVRPAI